MNFVCRKVQNSRHNQRIGWALWVENRSFESERVGRSASCNGSTYSPSRPARRLRKLAKSGWPGFGSRKPGPTFPCRWDGANGRGNGNYSMRRAMTALGGRWTCAAGRRFPHETCQTPPLRSVRGIVLPRSDAGGPPTPARNQKLRRAIRRRVGEEGEEGDCDTFVLENATVKPEPWRGQEPENTRQTVLLTGMDCRPGQQDLFETAAMPPERWRTNSRAVCGLGVGVRRTKIIFPAYHRIGTAQKNPHPPRLGVGEGSKERQYAGCECHVARWF